MASFPLVAPRPRRINAPPYRPQASPVASIMSPPADALSRLKLSEHDPQAATIQASTSDDISPPPSAGRASSSPLLNLPSDALEEFLSILRPAIFSPSSPTFRANNRRHEAGPSVVLSQPHVDRPQPFRSRDGMQMQIKSPLVASASADEDNLRTLTAARVPTPRLASEAAPESVSSTLISSVSSSSFEQPAVADPAPVPSTPSAMWRTSHAQYTLPRWLRSGAESPVSRTHTRNPFHRHPSYESATIAPPSAFSLRAADTTAAPAQSQLSPTLLPLPPSPSLSTASICLSPSAMALETLDEEQTA